jgi:hypothetical protein
MQWYCNKLNQEMLPARQQKFVSTDIRQRLVADIQTKGRRVREMPPCVELGAADATPN